MQTRPNSWLEDAHRRGKIDWMRYFGALLFLAYLVPVFSVIVSWSRFWGGYLLRPVDFYTTSGVISASEVIEEKSRFGHSFHYRIEYEYAVDGAQHKSSRITFGLEGFSTRDEAKTYIDRYPLGATVRVHYYHNDPAFAVLEPNTRDETLLVYWVLVFAMPVAVVGFIILAWVQPRNRLRRGLGRKPGVL